MYGTWDFYVSKDQQHINVYSSQEVCTHTLPNKLQFIGPDFKFEFSKFELWKINLMDAYKVEAFKCLGESSSNCVAKEKISGKWSPIYAQSLLVELDNGVRFVSNFRYNVKKNVTPNPLKENDLSKFSQLTTGSEESFDS